MDYFLNMIVNQYKQQWLNPDYMTHKKYCI